MTETPNPPGVLSAEADASADDFALPWTRLALRLDGIVRAVGRLFSWVWIILILVIIYNVVQRYVFGVGSIALEELQWHLYAVGFMVGLSYAFSKDRHVRVDVLAERWRPRTRAWVELLGLLLLLLPFSLAILTEAIPFAITSWNLNEVSSAPSGLPARWALKSFIIWGFGLLVIAAFSRLLRCMALLFGWPRPIWPRE